MNKLYLKVGVALTAAFAFGYFVGTELAIRKMREMIGEKADDFELVKQELIFQAAQQEPVKEEEEEDMAKRKAAKNSTVTESFHYDIPYELVVDEFGMTLGNGAKEMSKALNKAAERISKMEEYYVEEENNSMLQAIQRIQSSFNQIQLVNDITPYEIPKEARYFRFVYIRNANRLYWRIGDWRERFSVEDIEDILMRLMTFSIVRNLEDAPPAPTTWSPVLLMSEDGTLPGDDPELYNTRIFFLTDLNIVTEILIEPTDPYPGRIEALLEAHWEE